MQESFADGAAGWGRWVWIVGEDILWWVWNPRKASQESLEMLGRMSSARKGLAAAVLESTLVVGETRMDYRKVTAAAFESLSPRISFVTVYSVAADALVGSVLCPAAVGSYQRHCSLESRFLGAYLGLEVESPEWGWMACYVRPSRKIAPSTEHL